MMPSGTIKNIIYRAGLSLSAPKSTKAVFSYTGHSLCTGKAIEKIIYKHHIQGAYTYIGNHESSAEIYSSGPLPGHFAKPETFYRIASITKIATALLLLRYIEQGFFSLDGYVKDYFPVEGHHLLDQITIRHILSHTSGLSDPSDLSEKISNGMTYNDILRQESLRFSNPGTTFRYNNFLFGVLGCMIEYHFNEDLESLFQRDLFIPLGIKAFFDPIKHNISDIMPVTRVMPYHRNQDYIFHSTEERNPSVMDYLHHYGYTAGGLYTDPAGIKKLLEVSAVKEKAFLGTELFSEMTGIQAAYGQLDPRLFYGLGLFIIKDPSLSDSRILGHQGFAYGCVNGAFIEEDTGHTVIILNGGCSELRNGRMGASNMDFMRWAFREELPKW